MKRLIVLILVFCLLFSFASCKKKTEEDEVIILDDGETEEVVLPDNKTDEGANENKQNNEKENTPPVENKDTESNSEKDDTENENSSSGKENVTEEEQSENTKENITTNTDINEGGVVGEILPSPEMLVWPPFYLRSLSYIPLYQGHVTMSIYYFDYKSFYEYNYISGELNTPKEFNTSQEIYNLIKDPEAHGFCYIAKNDFVTKSEITGDTLTAMSKLPKRLQTYTNDMCNNPKLYANYGDAESLNEIESDFEPGTVVVKGHFEKAGGSSYCFYEVSDDGSFYHYNTHDPLFQGNWIGTKYDCVFKFCNYKQTKAYTLYNFVIDKVYTEGSQYKEGDTIELAKEGTVNQDFFGINYMDTEPPNNYAHFEYATPEERNYIVSFYYDQSINANHISGICQNVNTTFKPQSDSTDDKIAFEIFKKYIINS